MTGNTFFQIFLFVDIFIMGILATFIARHVYAHYHPEHHEPDNHSSSTQQTNHLSPAAKEHMLQESEEKFEKALNHSTDQLQKDLESTITRVNNMVERLASNIISGELERYQTELSKLHKQTEADLGLIKNQISEHQEEIKAKITGELEAEKQQLIKQINTKLSDAVGSFLIEALQHNVDLGSQGDYLVSLLEEHKADFIKGVADESQSTG